MVFFFIIKLLKIGKIFFLIFFQFFHFFLWTKFYSKMKVPELFRTMLLQEIIKQDIKITKDFDEKYEQMEISTEEKIKTMEDDIKNYNDTCESVEKMFAAKRKTFANYQKKKPVPVPDTKPIPLISALLLGTELQYLPAVATPISISSPAPISIPSPNIREVTQIPTPTNIPPPVAASVIPSPLVPTPSLPINPIIPLSVMASAPVVPTISATNPISQFAPGPQMPVSHIPTNPFNTIRPPIIPTAGGTAPAFARATGAPAAAAPPGTFFSFFN